MPKKVKNIEIPFENKNLEKETQLQSSVEEQVKTNFHSETESVNNLTINVAEQSVREPELKLTGETSKSYFSISEKVFIEIHKANLLQYFSSGCIYPSKYSSQKAFTDPQSINEFGLLISNGFFSYDKDHVYIEIDTLVINSALVTSKGGCAIYSGIIPISRIIKIYVHDSDTKKNIVGDALIRDSGFIPEMLIEVGIPAYLSRIDIVNFNINPENIDTQLYKFDKIMGLIAGTKNFNSLTYNQTGIYKTISDHTFYAIQAIDNSFAREIIDGGQLSDYYNWLFSDSCPDDRPLLKWVFKRVYDKSNFTDSDTSEFEKLCLQSKSFEGEEKQVKSIFTSLRSSLERKKALQHILSIQSKNSLVLYVFAYLRIYGTNQNPELPRMELSNYTINDFSEFAFATLNFFFGYEKLRNTEDRLEIADSTITNEIRIPPKPTIKFEMTTEFDYRIIDSVFNFVFDKRSNDFTKFTNIVNEQNIRVTKIQGYNFYSSKCFGKIYYKIKKLDIEDLLMNLPEEISIFSEFGLVCYRLGLKRQSISLIELIENPKLITRIIHFSKAELIKALKEKKIEEEEIKIRIKLSQKYKEL
jgi:hypothetical protein